MIAFYWALRTCAAQRPVRERQRRQQPRPPPALELVVVSLHYFIVYSIPYILFIIQYFWMCMPVTDVCLFVWRYYAVCECWCASMATCRSNAVVGWCHIRFQSQSVVNAIAVPFRYPFSSMDLSDIFIRDLLGKIQTCSNPTNQTMPPFDYHFHTVAS